MAAMVVEVVVLAAVDGGVVNGMNRVAGGVVGREMVEVVVAGSVVAGSVVAGRVVVVATWRVVLVVRVTVVVARGWTVAAAGLLSATCAVEAGVGGGPGPRITAIPTAAAAEPSAMLIAVIKPRGTTSSVAVGHPWLGTPRSTRPGSTRPGGYRRYRHAISGKQQIRVRGVRQVGPIGFDHPPPVPGQVGLGWWSPPGLGKGGRGDRPQVVTGPHRPGPGCPQLNAWGGGWRDSIPWLVQLRWWRAELRRPCRRRRVRGPSR
jgi:hypothetical protein